ncbi:KIR protein [Plasmodium coatneyi]|uniref:KIR protein n=1 Tax=Plasmodium coatneyi TaxID=208452 RepID=A0A1B1DVM5_9APIC|nr:KIR protein [Plasmodium coatneyi]ANQ06828.1 KIR protein [Plasmodium coatneyi]
MVKHAAAELTVIILFREENLNKLLSKKTYSKFDEGGSHGSTACSWLKGKDTEVKSILKNNGKAEDYAKQILGAHCYASSQVTNDIQSSSGLCLYFYFWLWDLLANQLQVKTSLGIMKQIYGELSEVSIEGKKCAIIYENSISKDIFPQVKTHFDYSKDYDTIMKHLGNGVSGDTKTCDKAYRDHLEAIKKACSAIEEDCKKDGGPQKSGRYCGPLQAAAGPGGKGGFAGHYCKDDILQKLQCTQVTEPQTTLQATDVQVNHVSSMGGGEGGSAAVGPIVYSVFGIGALPLTTFFLYKYDLLPSAIKNTLFGGGGSTRKKRSSIKHVFDTSTTEYSYNGSSGTDTATEYSIPYTTTATVHSTTRRRRKRR